MTQLQGRERTDRSVAYRERGWWRDETLADDIARHAAVIPDAPAFVTEHHRVSWREYAGVAGHLAGVGVAAGYQRGERVAVQLPDTAAVHITFVGHEKAGRVAVGIGARAGDRELRHLLAGTRASGLITRAGHRGRTVPDGLGQLREHPPALRHHVVRVQPDTELRLYASGRDVTSSGRVQPGSRGPASSLGYLDDHAGNAELFTPVGFVLHADEVTLDAEGYLTVVGRKSDIIIRGGKNISAPAVEDEVGAQPAVVLVAAVPSPDPVFGERVCVYVELAPGASLELDELVAFLRVRGVSPEYLPERLVLLKELPRSSGGKLAKGQLRDDAAARYGPSR